VQSGSKSTYRLTTDHSTLLNSNRPWSSSTHDTNAYTGFIYSSLLTTKQSATSKISTKTSTSQRPWTTDYRDTSRQTSSKYTSQPPYIQSTTTFTRNTMTMTLSGKTLTGKTTIQQHVNVHSLPIITQHNCLNIDKYILFVILYVLVFSCYH